MDLSKYKMRMTETHVYFYGGPCSQWFPSRFTAELPLLNIDPSDPTKRSIKRSGSKITVDNAEVYMMASKSAVFMGIEGNSNLQNTLSSRSPDEAKQLGREVRGLHTEKWTNDDIALWDTASLPIVTMGTYAKFSQNSDLYDFIMCNAHKTFVEGAPRDKYWGVALSWNDPHIEDSNNWRGANKLGRSLDAAAQMLMMYGRNNDAWEVYQRWRRDIATTTPAPLTL